MNAFELNQQKIIISVFNELREDIENNKSTMHKLGYSQRTELYKHVNNGYNNHENLNKARNEWEQNGIRNKVITWIYNLFVENRDIFGYFENYEQIKLEIDSLIERSKVNEMYDITYYLTEWRNKLP